MIASTVLSVVILCSNYNYHISPGCTPATFEQTHEGWHGTLVNGEKWTQEYITRDMMLFKTESEQLKYLVYKGHVVYLD
mgnify:CR=1 FL=1|jgi:hypothetical protein